MNGIVPDFNMLSIGTTDTNCLSLAKMNLKVQNRINCGISTMIDSSLHVYWILAESEVCCLAWLVAYLDTKVWGGFVVEDHWSDVVGGDEAYEHFG